VIGTIEAGGCLRVRLGGAEATLLDFATATVTGLGLDAELGRESRK
jgi:hypothetical protein